MSGFVQYSVFGTACAVNNSQDSSVGGSTFCWGMSKDQRINLQVFFTYETQKLMKIFEKDRFVALDFAGFYLSLGAQSQCYILLGLV